MNGPRRATIEVLLRACAFVACCTAMVGELKAGPLDKTPEITGVTVGYQGAYKLGHWTPVEITYKASPTADEQPIDAVRLTTVDANGDAVDYSARATILPRGEKYLARCNVQFGTADPELKIELGRQRAATEERGTLSADDYEWHHATTLRTASGDMRLPKPLGPHDTLVICVGPLAALDELALRRRSGGPGEKMRVVRYDFLMDVPESEGQAADHFVLYMCDQIGPGFEGEAVRKLPELLRRGCRMAIVAGPDFESPFTLRANEAVPLPRTIALEEYVGGELPLELSRGPLDAPLLVPRVTVGDGVVELAEGDLPLIVREAVGFGQLTTILVDLEHEGIKWWPGTPKLLAKAMRLDEAADDPARNAATHRSAEHGYDDLAGQLRSGLDQYDGVRPVSFFLPAMLVLGLIAVVGPLDYLLVHKVLKRPELTWLSLLVLTSSVVLLAMFSAKSLKGDRLHVSRVSIVDVDAETRLVRGTTFAGVFSPASRRYDIGLRPPIEIAGVQSYNARGIAAFGLPGVGLGGMHAPTSGRDLIAAGDSDCRFDFERKTLCNVPIDVWSSKLFVGHTFDNAREMRVAPLAVADDGHLTGTLTNPFSTVLRDTVLCHETNSYAIGDLPAGGVCDTATLERRSLHSYLTVTKQVAVDRSFGPKTRSESHDPGSRELADIVREMMFYEAAGGKAHAGGLANDDRASLDFSGLLRLRRAILIGRVEGDFAAAVEVSAGGQPVERPVDRGTTIVRLVIPVAPATP